MIKFENTEIVGFEATIRGMRNPLNSWAMSDTIFAHHCDYPKDRTPLTVSEIVKMGDNDMDLMKRLRNAGTDHRKYLRFIEVYVDITAPLYW